MDLPALLQQYGYLIIFAGTVVEGETLLMLGGYFAHHGYLQLPLVMLTAFAGAISGDQLFFYIGRHHARGLLERFPRLRDRVSVALRRVEHHQGKVVLSMRFLWGLRMALPLALGLSNMPARRFFWLNLMSAAIWSVVFALLGYGASHLLTTLVDDLRRYEWQVAGLLIVVAVGALGWHFGRPRVGRR
jgi:membrane protein DedA with SNARE-associated domain